jgi:hypothetical protein
VRPERYHGILTRREGAVALTRQPGPAPRWPARARAQGGAPPRLHAPEHGPHHPATHGSSTSSWRRREILSRATPDVGYLHRGSRSSPRATSTSGRCPTRIAWTTCGR